MLRFATSLESSRLHAVSAHLHLAPSARVILARVQEEPTAGVHAASANSIHGLRQHKLRCALRHDPHGKFGTGLEATPVPRQRRIVRSSFLPVASKAAPGARSRRGNTARACEYPLTEARAHLRGRRTSPPSPHAIPSRTATPASRLPRIHRAPKPAHLPRVEQGRLLREPQQISVVHTAIPPVRAHRSADPAS